MGQPTPHKTLVIACGALAREILALKSTLGLADDVFDLQCLPAKYHNTPRDIVPGLQKVMDEMGGGYDRILIGYGDCGTGGGIDRWMEAYPHAERLPGAHCYAFYAGLPEFDAMMEEEIGSFFLTDYLAAHFETLVIKGMGIDRYPELRDMYFEHFKRVVYISQIDDADLIDKARRGAEFLELEFVHRPVGYGELGTFIQALGAQNVDA